MMAVRTLLILMLTASVAGAADYYVDPRQGQPENDGSAAQPWQSLQRVIDSKMVESQTWLLKI